MHRIQVKTRIKKKMNQILLKIIVQHNDASGVICYDPDDREKNMRKFHNKITVAIKIHGKATNDVCTFRVSNRIRVVENTRRLHHIELPVKCASDHMRAQSDRRMYVFHCGKRSTFQMYFAGVFFFFFFYSSSFLFRSSLEKRMTLNYRNFSTKIIHFFVARCERLANRAHSFRVRKFE